MLADYAIPHPPSESENFVLSSLGLLFDVAGSHPKSVHDHITARRAQRPKSVEEALRSDMQAISGDMRRAFDMWASAHA